MTRFYTVQNIDASSGGIAEEQFDVWRIKDEYDGDITIRVASNSDENRHVIETSHEVSDIAGVFDIYDAMAIIKKAIDLRFAGEHEFYADALREPVTFEM